MSVRKLQSTHIASKKRVLLNYVDPKGIVNYPSDWFEKNRGKKPSVSIPRYSGTDEDLTRVMKGGIRGANLTLRTVKVFLYNFGRKIESALDNDWDSFGISIGREGDRITPWSLLNVTQETDPYVPTENLYQLPSRGAVIPPDDPYHWTDQAMALYIVCIYRLAKVTNEEYADSLQKRMDDQLKTENGRGMSFHGTRGIYGNWTSDSSFLKMIATIDMFLHRFIDNPASILRLGTLGSRFRDCAGLLSIGYAMSILNIESAELMDWIFLKTMGDEIISLTREGQEVGDPYSYFPYQADLGLVRRSAYSSNANPYLFTWINVIGAILGHKRSQNARFIFEGSYADIGLNAVLVTWVYARGGELSPQFSEDGVLYGTEIRPPGVDGDEVQAADPTEEIWNNTQGRDPKTWYSILKSSGFKVPTIVKKAIETQTAKVTETREDSVGAYVKQRFIY